MSLSTWWVQFVRPADRWGLRLELMRSQIPVRERPKTSSSALSQICSPLTRERTKVLSASARCLSPMAKQASAALGQKPRGPKKLSSKWSTQKMTSEGR
jgi:hypothetical protein